MKKIISLVAIIAVLVLSCSSVFAAVEPFPESWVSTDPTTEYAELFKNYIGDDFDADNFYLMNVSPTEEAYDFIGKIEYYDKNSNLTIKTNSEKELKFICGVYIPEEEFMGETFPAGFYAIDEFSTAPTDAEKFTITKDSSYEFIRYGSIGYNLNWRTYRKSIVGLQLLNPENLTDETMITVSFESGYLENGVMTEGAMASVTYQAPVEVSTYDELVAALKKDNANIIMTADITGTATTGGYSVAGIVLEEGDVLDGNGHTLTINAANSTWDCAIAMTGGTVKNLTIAGAMRGVFMPGANGNVVIDTCVFKDVIYTFNSDAGSKDYSVTIKNTTLNGWTSFSNVHKSVIFEDCTFGEGSGYAYCRPYQPTTFTGCDFNKGFELDTTPTQTADDALKFNGCTYAGEALSAENAAPLFSDGGTVVIDNEKVVFDKYVPHVAQIGDNKYTSLQSAIDESQDGEITLLADVTENITVAAGVNIVLDLNGNTLTGHIAPCEPETLAVKNGSIVNTDSGVSAIEINKGNLTLTDVNIESARHAVRIDGEVTAVIDGGTYKTTVVEAGKTQHALNVSGNANVTIKDGTFTGPNGTTADSGSAVNAQAGSTVTIEGGTFIGGKNHTLSAAGTLTVKGGAFDQDPTAYLADGYVIDENADGTYGVSFNSITCEWTTDTDAGYYMNGTDKLGLMRWLFMATVNGTIDTIGIEYQGATQNTQVFCDTVITDGDVVFYGDVNGFTETEATKDTYSARGFVKSGSTTNYSDIVTNAPNWDRELDYKGGNE